MASKPVVLITGASEGVGRATASFLAERGFIVFGTSRNPSAVQALPGVDFVELDVRSQASVSRCIDTVLGRAGHVSALVANAGIQLHGSVEETSIEEAWSLFDTNFFGSARVIRELLPHMRERGSGRIIAISSTSGFCPQPFFAYYSASKHALEGLAESLRYEVMPFGIDVTILELGGFKTQILGSNEEFAAQKIGAYAPWRERAQDLSHTYVTLQGADPIVVAEQVHRILTGKARGARHRAGRDVSFAFMAKRLLPSWWLERGRNKAHGIKNK